MSAWRRWLYVLGGAALCIIAPQWFHAQDWDGVWRWPDYSATIFVICYGLWLVYHGLAGKAIKDTGFVWSDRS